MEFRFNVNNLFKNSEVVEITNNLLPYGFNNSGGDKRILWDTQSKITQIINALGEASARAQNLTTPITTADRLRNSEHIIYLLIDQNEEGELTKQNDRGAVIGMLKIGTKSLYIFDRMGQHYQISSTLCILDFYVHESKQRSGYGKKLFDYMLQKEHIDPVKIAIDRPSVKFLNFLNKHYSLNNPIKQMNNFVVFDGFFSTLSSSSENLIRNTDDDDGTTKNQRKGQGAITLNNKLSQEFEKPTGYNCGQYGRYNVAHRPHCSMGEIIHNDSPIVKYNVERTAKNDNMAREKQHIDRPQSLFNALQFEQSDKVTVSKQEEKKDGIIEGDDTSMGKKIEDSEHKLGGILNDDGNHYHNDLKINNIDFTNQATANSNGNSSPSLQLTSPLSGEETVAAGIITPGRCTPGLTEQGYFDLKFFHNKLW